MKKNGIILILIVFLLLLNGCNKESKEKFNCDILNDVKMFIYTRDGVKNYLLTNDGSLYIIGNYSDGINCKKINSNEKFKGYYKENFENLVSIDNRLFDLNNDNITLSNEKNKYVDVLKTTEVFYNENNGDIKYTGYLLKEDGNIYLHHYYLDEMDEIFKSFSNEKVLDFDSSRNKPLWIKTDRAYYINKIINQEECNKYDDVECKYEYEKSEILTNKYNDISFIGSDYGDIYYVLKNGYKIINPNL